MGFSTVFKNFGHAIATGAKYVAIGIKDVIMVANKSQAIAPEVEALAGALAGPLGVKVSDMAFHVLGDVAAALQKLGDDTTTLSTSTNLNLVLDTAIVNDIKLLIPTLTAIIKSVGGVVPKA